MAIIMELAGALDAIEEQLTQGAELVLLGTCNELVLPLEHKYVFHVFRFALGFCVFSWNTWNTWNTQLCIPFCIPRGVAQKYKYMYSRDFFVYSAPS